MLRSAILGTAFRPLPLQPSEHSGPGDLRRSALAVGRPPPAAELTVEATDMAAAEELLPFEESPVCGQAVHFRHPRSIVCSSIC